MKHVVTSSSPRRHWGVLVFVALSLSLSGCKKFTQDVETLASASLGGGGNDGGEDYTGEHGAAYYLGTPSSEDNAIANLFLGTKSTYGYGTHDSLIDAHAAENAGFNLPIASRDTNARSQWMLGWTGKDVKVGVLDEFNSNNLIDTHGDKVSLVVNSVAPEAQLTEYNFTLNQQAAEDAFLNFNTQEIFIINNSWGAARFSHIDGEEDTEFDASIANWVSQGYKITGTNSYDEKMLFVFSAGNSGTYCPDKRIQECSFYPAVLFRQRQLGREDQEAYIWVGSLTDDGTALADYSHSAGDMGSDFIVAHDDVLSANDGAGTSYAAPRVAGAAALVRHKFPGLSGMQLKSLLLSTATDIGEPGIDAIYGHGKLNLENALSPQGRLTAD
jgi:subtilisin family serine protease